MLTRNQIIEKLFTGKNFNECIQKMEPAHLRDDLKMEVIAIVCEWPDEKVIQLHDENKLEFCVARVIINQIQSSTSPFYRTYRNANLVYIEDPVEVYMNESGTGNTFKIVRKGAPLEEVDHEERLLREELEDYALKEIDELPLFYCKIIRLYMEHKTFRALEALTMIPYSTCYKSVKRGIEMLRKRAEIWENPVMTRNIEKYEP